MTTPALVDDAGRPVRLGPPVAPPGGEGTVFALPDQPGVVAKVYHPGKVPPDIADKLRAEIGLTNRKLADMTAWPTGVLFDRRTRAAAGLLMPRLDGFQKLQELYNPVQRLKSFPRAGWDFQVQAAANLAAAFDEVHAVGCLVADVNQSNAFVSVKALVRLIDCDSFQVPAGGRPFLCDVGTPLYVPPELIGQPLRGRVRTENHDRFGLAVLVYQLLFVGRHPYAGVYSGRGDPSPDELIAGYKFAQGPAAHTWGMAPPPHTPTLADLPPGVGGLFRRAFERGSEAGTRPRPTDWVATLRRLGQEVATCPTDPGHKYWKGAAGGCVWCRIARAGGPEYYYGVADGGGRFAVDETRLAEVLRRLAAVPADPFPYTRAAFAPAAPTTARPLPGALAELLRGRQAAEAARRTVADQRRAADDQERGRAEEQERQAVADIGAAFRRRDASLAAEIDAVRTATRTQTQRGQVVTSLLVAALVLGVVLVGLGCIHKGFLLAGGLTLCVVGVLLTDHLMRSPAAVARRQLDDLQRQRETAREHADDRVRVARGRTQRTAAEALAVTRRALEPHDEAVRAAERAFQQAAATERTTRERTFADAEATLKAAEREWADVADTHRFRHAETNRAVNRLAADCRGLAAEYQAELGRLTAGAAAQAKARHLRLHLLADADIPKVGAGRKQALAVAGVFTAADVTETAVRSVRGFGDALTATVLAWRAEVERQFRFDPTTAVPPAALREVTARCLARQQQVLAEVSRHVAELEVSLAAGRQATQAFVPVVRAAVAAHAQADRDRQVSAAGG